MNRPIPTPARRRLPHLFVWAVLLLLAAALRLFRLDLQPLWWDEGFSLYFATERPARLLELTALDIHPPLYYLLLQGWLALTGIGAVQARLLSVLLSLLSIPSAALVARHLGGPRLAWTAAFLLTLSPFHIYYAQEVRMYGLMTLLALLATWFLLERRWWLFGATMALGLYTQYYFAFFAAALLLVGLRRFPSARRQVVAAGAGAGVAFLPWLLYAGPRLVSYVDRKIVIESDTPMTPLEFLPRHLVAWGMGHLPAGWEALGWGALLLLGLAIIGLRRLPGDGRRDLGLLIGVPTAGIFVVGLFLPFIDPRIERQLLMVLPFLLVLVAAGLDRLWHRARAGALAAAVGVILVAALSLAAFYTVPRYPGEDYRPLLTRLRAEQAPGDGWLAIYEWQIGYLRAYLPEAHPTPDLVPLTWAEDEQARAVGLQTLLDRHPRLWLPAYQVKGRQLEEEIAATLAAQGVPVWDAWYGNTRLYLTAHAPNSPPLADAGEIVGVGPLSGALAAASVESGRGIVPLFLALEDAPEGLRVSAQLQGHGAVWGEWDGPLRDGAARGGIPVAAGTPPGPYEVGVTIYRAADGTALTRRRDGRPDGTVAVIGQVDVRRPSPALDPAQVAPLLTVQPGATLGGTIRLLGAALPEESLQQGDALPVTLFWQAVADGSRSEQLFLQLLDPQGQIVAARESLPVSGAFPTSRWRAGDLIRDPQPMTIPADLPPGDYRLIAGLYDPVSGRRLAAPDGRDQIGLGDIPVTERQRLMTRPTVGAALWGESGLPVGARARLVEAQLPSPTRMAGGAGQLQEVVLLWQATATGGPPLRAFVQYQGPQGEIETSDHLLEPPSSAWIVGEWIVDRHTIRVPACADRLVAGLYDAASGERLATDEGDTILLSQLTCIEE